MCSTSRWRPRCSRIGAEMALPFPLVYSERYDLHLGDHVFPSKKYKWLHDRLVRTKFAAPESFVEPEPASDDDLLLVHEAQWVDKLRHGTLTYQDILTLEIPYSEEMAEAFWLAAGGTLMAARQALAGGGGFNNAGGLHPPPAAGACRRRGIQHRRRLPPRVPGARRRLLRDQRYGGGHPAAAKRRRHQAGHGGGLRCAPRQRDGADLHGRPIGIHAFHPPVQELSFGEAALEPGHSSGGWHRRRRVS